MEMDSPASRRISAALKALRQTHSPEAGDAVGLAVKCLHAVIGELAANGVSSEDLQPLADLEGFANRRKTPDTAPNEVASLTQSQPQTPREQRRASPPSATLLARASVLIDLLVKAGQDEPEAAQTAMRQLLAVGVPPPAQGGDSRGWRRLLEFRNTLLQGGGHEDAQYEYRTFARELDAIAPAERVSRVLEERIWDRRRRQR